MKRVFLIVLDGTGAGALPDAGCYGDEGANTLRHVAEAAQPALPNLTAMGLGEIPGLALTRAQRVCGAFGRAREQSAGKDTTTGHWEIAGLPLRVPFPTFPNGFPDTLIHAFEKAVGRGTLGNKAASGTVILDELGEAHLKTGKLIVYTSADSVFQIAAHVDVVPLEELYRICETARGLLQGEWGVGRVIARPFTGAPGCFKRTPDRRDFSMPPVGRTLLDALCEAGYEVRGVGKIEDIFAHRGLTASNHAAGNPACIEALLKDMDDAFTGLCFVNLVDTDSLYGHRRDVNGFAAALEAFDRRLPDMMNRLSPDDLMIITADHGCDPAFPGTDHTREYAPLLIWRRGMTDARDLGIRDTFADTAATIAEFFGLSERFSANSYLNRLYIGQEAKPDDTHGTN